MSNHLSSLLEEWYKAKDSTEWVLGTVYKTEGSAYRKAGAMMLINGHGQQFGLLSGGCLEADIIRNARKVMMQGKCLTLVYDGNDEDDLSFQLGIGCGGKIYIMLQPIIRENNLGLSGIYEALLERKSGVYYQKIGEPEARFVTGEERETDNSVIENNWLVTSIRPEPHLLVVGGGIDARPLVSMAKEMGWRVTLTDPRPANARTEFFSRADVILREVGRPLSQYIETQKVDVAVLMSHSINLDADGLKSFQQTRLKHVALLGPKHRYFQVLEASKLRQQDLTCPVSGPAGLDIGGQLPESIALSILAEMHQVLHKKKSRSQLHMAAE